jgi:hypothetical protein
MWKFLSKVSYYSHDIDKKVEPKIAKYFHEFHNEVFLLFRCVWFSLLYLICTVSLYLKLLLCGIPAKSLYAVLVSWVQYCYLIHPDFVFIKSLEVSLSKCEKPKIWSMFKHNQFHQRTSLKLIYYPICPTIQILNAWNFKVYFKYFC